MTKTHFDISLWEKRILRKQKQNEDLRKKTLHYAREVVKNYFADKKVSHVYLAGSLLYTNKFRQHSDIDIAVEGLQDDFFKIKSELEGLLDRDVEIIELEKCRFARSIRERGERVL